MLLHETFKDIEDYLNSKEMLSNREEIFKDDFQPPKNLIFRVFKKPLNSIKVVILGMDPYPKEGVANGLAFAVNKDIKIPKSLLIIKNEIKRSCEIGFIDKQIFNTEEWKTLLHWREQGIFLLNTALTVATGKSGSHIKYWKNFTELVIKHISKNTNCVWLLLGKNAEIYKDLIYNRFIVKDIYENIPINKNYIIIVPHPIAEVYNPNIVFKFTNSNIFIKTNYLLNINRKKQIKF